MIFKTLVLFLISSLAARAQLIADFVTTEGNFSVDLHYVSAPLACANFVLLSGKGDDVWETPAGAPSFTSSNYITVAESETARQVLNVRFVAADPADPSSKARYDIVQSTTVLGSVSTTPNSFGVLSDITGENRFELKQIDSNPNKFQIRFKYRRQWVDSRFQTIREAPMYQSIPITRVERGKRFFSGSFTNNDFDNPGYFFQDESILVPGNPNSPYGQPFNSAWVLAMDTTQKNRNGSRFFITSASDPALNGRYTSFGTVIQGAGRQVVTNIANRETNAAGVPNTPMSILSISFRRGFGALSFFESYHQGFLPGFIRPLPLTIERRDGQLSLLTALKPQSQTSISTSLDLKTFESGGLLSQPPSITVAPVTDISAITAIAPRYFLKGFTTALPNWPSAELNLKGTRYLFRLNSDGALGSLSLTFGTEGNAVAYEVDTTAQWNIPGEDPVTVVTRGSGTAGVSYTYAEGPYRGKMVLNILSGPLQVNEFTLHFESLPITAPLVLRSFSAIQSGGGPFAFGYSGHYYRQN
jgi:cyclophilin family peptidyl-prolyl cis-trans isomerase